MALMNKRHLVLLALLACLTGCVPVDCINPLYTDQNVIFDPALVGKWVTGSSEEGVLRFDRAEKGAYQMVITQKTASGHPQETVCGAPGQPGGREVSGRVTYAV
jgi:hypothetical protein